MNAERLHPSAQNVTLRSEPSGCAGLRSANIPRATTAALLAVFLSSVSPAQDARPADRVVYAPNPPPVATMDLTQGVYVASIDAEDRSIRRYAGNKLYNTEGADLGGVRDFIVHPATGRLRFIVVSTGGVLGGIGNSLRLVPFEAVRRGSRGNVFEVDILQASWLQIPPISDKDYVNDRFNFSSAQHQELARHFGSTQQVAVADNDLLGLVRGSVLRGKPVYSADHRIGKIENVIVDLDRGTAAALLDAASEFTGTNAKYIVPLPRLGLADVRAQAIGTNLTRMDFDRATPGHFNAPATMVAVQPPRPAAEPPLAPTGRPSSPVVIDPTNDPLVASATAVRRAIDSDPSLVAENVQVSAENGRVVLRGSVRSDATRSALETTARRAFPTGMVESQLRVVPR